MRKNHNNIFAILNEPLRFDHEDTLIYCGFRFNSCNELVVREFMCRNHHPIQDYFLIREGALLTCIENPKQFSCYSPEHKQVINVKFTEVYFRESTNSFSIKCA